MKKKSLFLKSRSKLYQKISKRAWFYLNVFFSCVYLLWRFFFTIPLEYGLVSIIAGLSLFIVELFGLLEALIHYYNLRDVLTYPLPQISPVQFPHVDVFIATYNEPVELLHKTINGCLHMDYPDKSRVHIYLCDDGRRPAMRALAQEMGINYLDREDNKHAKAGNLNNALLHTASPYIATLDADMIPFHDFLLKTLPYFVGQELDNEGKSEQRQVHIGFVQTPQAFYNPDLFQFNLFSEGRIPNEQDYFYRDIQVSRNKTNSVIYGGSNTVISRKALGDIGGFYTETVTEDYATGILIQKQGYRCIGVGEVLASGLSPNDLQSLITQRIRWARGVIASNRKMHILFTTGLSFGQKINYWASKWYWYSSVKRLVYFLSPILFSVFGYMVLECTLPEILVFWLPMYLSSNIVLRSLSQNLRTTKWTSLYETVLFPFMLFPVILETFGITMKKFKVTSKDAAHSRAGQNLLYLIPFALLSVLSVIGIINCLRLILNSGDMGPSVVLFWLIVNLFTLVMAMFFVLGRNLMRKSERAFVRMPCKVKTAHAVFEGTTLDLSETGLAIALRNPVYINPDAKVHLLLQTQRYTSEIEVRVVHVDERDTDWKYAFCITSFLNGHEAYLQILYDRVPTLPQEIDRTSGSFDDLRINIKRRATKPTFQNRALPRVAARFTLRDTEHRTWSILDFNYQFCALSAHSPAPKQLTLVLSAKEGLFLQCRLKKNSAESKLLYEVVNCDALDANPRTRQLLALWAKQLWHHKEDEENTTATPAPAQEAAPQEEIFQEMEYV